MRLNEVFSNWNKGGGIFSLLQNKGVPWASENIAINLDLAFHGNYAGQKYISPLLFSFLNDNVLPPKSGDDLANVIFTLYSKSWSKMWDTLSFEYNPIENYDMTENMSDDNTSITYGKKTDGTNANNNSKTGTETTTPNLKSETDNNVYAFNSNSAVPSSEQNQVTSGNSTIEHNVKVSDNGTNSVTESGTDTTSHSYTLTRHGNIGVTTSQQMLQSERELWMWNYFIDVVFPNVADVLTLQIY